MHLILTQPTLTTDTGNNLHAIEETLAPFEGKTHADDLILLPEHFTMDSSEEHYLDYLRRLHQRFRCAIVGGSHHRKIGEKTFNAGNVIDTHGAVVGEYKKVRPYFGELQRIAPAESITTLVVNDCTLTIMICADFWYADLLLALDEQPDILLVPALSVSRKPDATYARSLWRHLAIARAYEFGVYVGISDWSAESRLPKYRTSGVAGFADPSQVDHEQFFDSVEQGSARAFHIDHVRLHAFRDDRRMRGFFWKRERGG